jgi:hypothetical protein
MTTIREFLDSDFDEIVARWHQPNLVSYPYVRAHQEHSLEDARQFFRDTLLPECRVWVAARAFYEWHGFSVVAFGVSPAPESERDVEYRWQAA